MKCKNPKNMTNEELIGVRNSYIGKEGRILRVINQWQDDQLIRIGQEMDKREIDCKHYINGLCDLSKENCIKKGCKFYEDWGTRYLNKGGL